MPLDIQLDDRRFQDLVNEARQRVAHACPEWTERNTSDPGIAMIEQFAWLAETLIYRLNRVPDKVHAQLLDLLGIRLSPPLAAHAQLRFLTAEALREPLVIPAGTEVGTLQAQGDATVFQVREDREVPVARLAAYGVRRGETQEELDAEDGVVRPGLDQQVAFAAPPQPGDAFYLGFEHSIADLVIDLTFDAGAARGTGVNPERPPLRWETSSRDWGWEEVAVLDDTTGGFLYGPGTIRLQTHFRSGVGERRLHWLRCRVLEPELGGGQYTAPPEIYAVQAATAGALVLAVHAASAEAEVLGVSDGTPGQTFRLRHAPALLPLPGERLEVQNPDTGDWEAWEQGESFAGSSWVDRHYVLDAAAGVVELGPAIRSGDGRWRQHGAVPPRGAVLRMSRYRYGGGQRGNVEAGTLTVLRSALPGIAQVSNPRPATGGLDGETVAAARTRAPIELRTRYRAVTAEDYEYLCAEASPRVARAVCLPAAGRVRLHLLPRVDPADRRLEYDELLPGPDLLEEVAKYLDARRVLGTTVELLPASVRGVTVAVDVAIAPGADPVRVEEDVVHALYTYVNPIVGGSLLGPGDGWPFGRPLNQGELYGVIHAVDGVEFVRVLRMVEVDLRTGERRPRASGTQVTLEPDEVVASGVHLVRASHELV